MTTESLIPINIVIGDRTYRIKINPKDEEVIRRTVKTINDKIIEFKTQFAGKDMQDYIAMVTIWYATQAAANANNSNLVTDQETINTLTLIEKQLDQFI